MHGGRHLLFEHWALLSAMLAPGLFRRSSDRDVVIWTVGSEEDAVAATALAVDACARNDTPPGRIRTYVTGAPKTPLPLHFTEAQTGTMPDMSLHAWFEKRSHHWVPGPQLSGAIRFGPPPSAVDLVTLRTESPVADAGQARSLLRRGGHLVCANTRLARSAALTEVSAIGAGCLYRKTTSGHVPTSAGQGADDSISGRCETLARRRLERDLIQSHTNLARALARRFARRGETVEDLEQVAMLALVRAARRYEVERSSAFSTYASASILGELKRHFRDRMWVLRVPRSTKELYLRVRAARELLSHELAGSPTIGQVAEYLHVGEEDVIDAMEAGESFRPGSIDGTPGAFDEQSEIPAVDESFDRALDRQRLCEILPSLDQRQQTILKGLYFDEMTQREVAREIGISQMQVSRLHAAVLEELRREFDPATP